MRLIFLLGYVYSPRAVLLFLASGEADQTTKQTREKESKGKLHAFDRDSTKPTSVSVLNTVLPDSSRSNLIIANDSINTLIATVIIDDWTLQIA